VSSLTVCGHDWSSSIFLDHDQSRTDDALARDEPRLVQGPYAGKARSGMSEPELAYMTGNDDFDLPRWQTQASLDSNSSHSPYYAPPPPPLAAHRNSQSHQSPTTSTRQPRINQIVEEDNQFGVAPIQYSPGSLSRSASMNSTSANSRRRHDLEEASNVDSQRQFAGGSQHPSSLYPSSVPYPPQQSGNTAEAPYHDVYYNASQSHPPKRSQTQHDPATSNRSGRSPMRQGPLSSQSTLDSYSSQQAQYSPTTAGGGYSYPDQQQPQQQRSYNPSAYQQTHNRVHSNPEHPDPPYPPAPNQTSLSPGIVNSPAHLAPRSGRQNSSSVPSSPLSFSHHPAGGIQEGPASNHYYPQEPQPMMVEPTAKRKLAGFRRVRDASDLHPVTTRPRTGRRMDGNGIYLSVRALSSNSSAPVFFWPSAFS
jgi:dual specificity protein kinase YAK1